MTITLELTSQIEARLTAEAAQRGLSTEALAGKLLEEALLPVAPGTGKLTEQGLKDLTELLTRGSENLPVLPPEANNRDFYYEDRW